MANDTANSHEKKHGNEQASELAYFAQPLPWQTQVWQKLTDSFDSETHNISHALLASGRRGIGKRYLVWRWVAWQLCQQKLADVACGNCQSCLWLQAGTHPDLCILPMASSPTFELSQATDKLNSTKKAKKMAKSASKTKKIVPRIKIDDIRDIQNFVTHTSTGMRICVFDHADTMTIGAANALLKTLEEPRRNVQLILMTDNPTLLLPTINSRVQKIPLHKIDMAQATNYLQQKVNNIQDVDNSDANQSSQADIKQLLKITSYAPLASIELAQSAWYPMREMWLKTWLALRGGHRTAIAACDYWLTQLELNDFIAITQLMIDDLRRLSVGFATYQQDIDFSVIPFSKIPTDEKLSATLTCINEINDSLKQNVQEKYAYDMLMAQLKKL